MDAPTPDLETAVAEIREAAAAAERNRAIDLAIAAMSRQLEHPVIFRWVAEGLEEDGRPFDALALFNRAQHETPDDIELKMVFAAALVRHDAHLEAIAPLEAILAQDPDHFDALMMRGAVALALRNLDVARQTFQRTAAAWPMRFEPLVELATLAAQQGEWGEARAAAEQAIALNPAAEGARLAIARADLAARKTSEAKSALEALLANPRLPDTARAEALTLLGDALDALDEPQKAFGLWRAREALLLQLRAPALARTPADTNIRLARRLADFFRRARAEEWGPAPRAEDGQPPVRGHVFLLSFPRSGATLLEQILASHPNATAVDESVALAMATDRFLADDQSLEGLARIDAREARACREAYWARVTAELTGSVEGKVFVDKNPLNSFRLPIISKLFPQAKIIFALRDPRDVILSAWRRLYYSQLLEFMTLEGGTEFYASVMQLSEIYRAKLQLPIHDLKHEALVSDFEPEVRRALAFMGLPWDPAVAEFAQSPVVNVTPSAAQIGRGLNREGVAQWRRYAAELTPVCRVVEPWVQRFGYPPSPGGAATGNGASLSRVLDEIGRALQGGRLAEAMKQAQEALAVGHVHPLLHRLRGVLAQQEGRLDTAISDFEAALSLGGEDAAVLNALGLALARAGRLAEGLQRIDRAIALQPNFAAFHYNRGWTLEAMTELGAAREAYERAVAIDPRNAQALASLANLSARAGDWEATKPLAERALALDPALPAAAVALARTEFAMGDAAGAETRLRAVLASGRAHGFERAVALEPLGDALDTLDRPREAFEAYSEAASLLRAQYAPRFHREGAERTTAFVRRLNRAFLAQDRAAWSRRPQEDDPQAPRRHVFVLGFPRSGTTLMGQVLAGGEDVVTLDERQTLTDAAQTFLRAADGPDRLAVAADEELQAYRRLYWDRVRAAGVDPAGRTFVDKLPMNTLGLPLIARLFPQAKVLFMRRDPRDVVISCFRRQFAIDATTVEFLSLDWAADLYDATMTLAETYRGLLDVDLQEQSMEALVTDFESEVRQICEFAQIPFAPAMADFASRSGDAVTRSSAQLARGLNAEGVGAWKRYAEGLAPVLPTLSPWAKRFGYDRR
ncbi:MAG TPA: sulfotransferase [Caulobacteraceae bacterium]|nr:sulfotransferase [Caulobacteraceae bacterium]